MEALDPSEALDTEALDTEAFEEVVKIDIIIEMLKNIEERLSSIESNLGIVIDKNKKVGEDCSKMREHINFVENTYSLIRTPLSYIKNKIEFVMGSKPASDLPLLDYTYDDVD
jgi:archaellum component FlaC